MNMLVDGEWRTDVYQATDEDGNFERDTTSFRDWLEPDPEAEYPAEAGRYHLYVSLACPWAHRTLLARALLGLDDAISVDVVDPYRENDGWAFSPDRDGCTPDSINGYDYLRDTYTHADPDYTGRVTVPVLWDTERETIVNNESREILRLLDTAFTDYQSHDVTLLPDDIATDIDETIDAIYEPINNGVYRAGFADTQAAYETAVDDLFDALDHYEAVLDDRRFLCGDQLTEADICMFTTLIRFDHVYHTIPTTFAEVSRGIDDPRYDKWNRLQDYDNLSAYTRDIYQLDGVAETVNLEHIVEHYASPGSPNLLTHAVEDVNLDLDAPHDRNQISDAAPLAERS
jgi:putative glutathione S-transferase